MLVSPLCIEMNNFISNWLLEWNSVFHSFFNVEFLSVCSVLKLSKHPTFIMVLKFVWETHIFSPEISIYLFLLEISHEKKKGGGHVLLSVLICSSEWNVSVGYSNHWILSWWWHFAPHTDSWRISTIYVLVLINPFKIRRKREIKYRCLIWTPWSSHLTAHIAVLQLYLRFSKRVWRTERPPMAELPHCAVSWARWESQWSGKKEIRHSNQVISIGWDKKKPLQSCWSETWR